MENLVFVVCIDLDDGAGRPIVGKSLDVEKESSWEKVDWWKGRRCGSQVVVQVQVQVVVHGLDIRRFAVKEMGSVGTVRSSGQVLQNHQRLFMGVRCTRVAVPARQCCCSASAASRLGVVASMSLKIYAVISWEVLRCCGQDAPFGSCCCVKSRDGCFPMQRRWRHWQAFRSSRDDLLNRRMVRTQLWTTISGLSG